METRSRHCCLLTGAEVRGDDGLSFPCKSFISLVSLELGVPQAALRVAFSGGVAAAESSGHVFSVS